MDGGRDRQLSRYRERQRLSNRDKQLSNAKISPSYTVK